MPQQLPDNQDEEELDQFLRLVQRRALVTARLSVPHDEALDCVQTAMFRFVRKYRSKSSGDWRPLFFRVLYNCLRDWHRRQSVRKSLSWISPSPESLQAASPQPDRWLASGEAGRELLSQLSQLPLRQQQAFVMRHWEGMDTKTAAMALGVSPGTLKTHLSRAMRRLRRTLEEHHESTQ